MEIFINADNLIVGRMATFAAKSALLGDTVKILNCENSIVTGNREFILEKFSHKRQMGNTSKGPFFPRMPDRFVRRTIRGMLPHKRPKGREAFKRILCYAGVPEEFKDKKMITLPNANVSKMKNQRFVYVKEICKHMGAKI